MKLSPRRLLSISALLMLVGAALHTIGNLLPSSDPSLIALENTMRAFRFSAGLGMNPSMFDVHMTLVLTMTVNFVALGVLNLVLAGAHNLSGHLLRQIIWINVLWVAASIALCAFYRVTPPLISSVIIELPLVAALLVRAE